MSNYNLDIASIEAFLYDAINGKVSKNTFTGLPDTTKASWKDMCLVDCGNAINDMRSYGRGSVMICLAMALRIHARWLSWREALMRL